MKRIKDVTIMDAVMHLIDGNGDRPILNDNYLELDEESYVFIYKHIVKALKSDDLKTAEFYEDLTGTNQVKSIGNELLDSRISLLDASRDIAKIMFMLTKDRKEEYGLIIASISTEYGPYMCVLKVDYSKSFTYKIDSIEDKMAINLRTQRNALNATKKLHKACFIGSKDLFIIDNQNKIKSDEYGEGYFIDKFLRCNLIKNERDNTRDIIKGTENFVRQVFREDAEEAEKVRTGLKQKLKREDSISIDELSEGLFSDDELKNKYKDFLDSNNIDDFNVDKEYLEKKLNKIKLKIDKDI
ncbi:nucleoid-associated protein [Clostridium hydrogeniformans]|uniref:nucleoid-associated protein n=1 Tax=Clostridium hydrogeniformans TaxID=349933 RepID=UPI0009FC9F1F|nr:nucleoid-associated protein [Clostridium hydrogeniformans]